MSSACGCILYSRNFRGVFIFREFRKLIPKRENKNSRNIFPSFINERKVCTTMQWHAKCNTALSVNAKLLNLEGLSLHSRKS